MKFSALTTCNLGEKEGVIVSSLAMIFWDFHEEGANANSNQLYFPSELLIALHMSINTSSKAEKNVISVILILIYSN